MESEGASYLKPGVYPGPNVEQVVRSEIANILGGDDQFFEQIVTPEGVINFNEVERLEAADVIHPEDMDEILELLRRAKFRDPRQTPGYGGAMRGQPRRHEKAVFEGDY